MLLRSDRFALRRVSLWLLFAMMTTTAASWWPVGSAMGAYSSSTESTHVATVPEAYELSGLVASPTYPNWYWSHSDVWKTTDVFSACTGLFGSARAKCQQVQWARIWALKIHPVTHAVIEARSFSLSNPAWALDPDIAQNNDWEDIALGPARTNSVGVTSVNLILAATGNAEQNRVHDGDGQDITCDTRRLIELREPDLSKPAVTTWTPWKIYDVKNFVGIRRIKACNVESLAVSTDGAGRPTAYLVTKELQRVLARSLDEATGRDPATPRAAADSGLPYRPAVSYVGRVRDAAGLKFTGAATNGAYVSLLVPRSSKRPCQILTWPVLNSGLGATLTGTSPVKNVVTCTPKAEGIAYTRSPEDPAVSTNDLLAISDAQSTSRSKFTYWYLPDS